VGVVDDDTQMATTLICLDLQLVRHFIEGYTILYYTILYIILYNTSPLRDELKLLHGAL
jgi:hypothetical protein